MRNKWHKIEHGKFDYIVRLTDLWLVSLVVLISIFVIKRNNFNIILLDIIVGIIPLILYFVTKKNAELNTILDKFINVNNLCKTHKSIVDEHLIYEYYPNVLAKREKKEISIKVRLDGSLLSEKFCDENIEKALEDSLQSVCIEKYEDMGYLYMTFDSLQQEQLRVKLDDIKQNQDKNILEMAPNIYVDIIKTPHFILTGLTGSGKTYYSTYLISQLTANGVRVIYLDPKNDSEMYAIFSHLPGCKYVTDIEKIHDMVISCEKEMRSRQKELEGIPGVKITFAPVYIVFDELIAFHKLADKTVLRETMNALASIIVQGRSKQTYVGVICQRIDTKYLDGALRENFGIRIAMGNNSSISYEMVFGPEFSKVKNRSQTLGSGLIMRQGIDSRPRPFIAPYLEK